MSILFYVDKKPRRVPLSAFKSQARIKDHIVSSWLRPACHITERVWSTTASGASKVEKAGSRLGG